MHCRQPSFFIECQVCFSKSALRARPRPAQVSTPSDSDLDRHRRRWSPWHRPVHHRPRPPLITDDGRHCTPTTHPPPNSASPPPSTARHSETPHCHIVPPAPPPRSTTSARRLDVARYRCRVGPRLGRHMEGSHALRSKRPITC
jgi:hypothetical protein